MKYLKHLKQLKNLLWYISLICPRSQGKVKKKKEKRRKKQQTLYSYKLLFQILDHEVQMKIAKRPLCTYLLTFLHDTYMNLILLSDFYSTSCVVEINPCMKNSYI